MSSDSQPMRKTCKLPIKVLCYITLELFRMYETAKPLLAAYRTSGNGHSWKRDDAEKRQVLRLFQKTVFVRARRLQMTIPEARHWKCTITDSGKVCASDH